MWKRLSELHCSCLNKSECGFEGCADDPDRSVSRYLVNHYIKMKLKSFYAIADEAQADKFKPFQDPLPCLHLFYFPNTELNFKNQL